MNKPIYSLKFSRGFSLVELAVVLVILGFVLAALLLPLQAQRENTLRLQTENQLEIARKAIIGFAQTHGRLPCPATDSDTGIYPDGTGISNPNVSGACAQQLGFLPAATLGIQPTDPNGFAIDGWGNRIRYAVTQKEVSNDAAPVGTADATFTTDNGMSNAGLSRLGTLPSLRVCNGASPSTLTCSLPAGSNETNYLIKNAVAIIYSLGATAMLESGWPDETENLNFDPDTFEDNVFVSRGISGSNHPGGEFDHMVVWISPYVLYNSMIQAGQLH